MSTSHRDSWVLLIGSGVAITTLAAELAGECRPLQVADVDAAQQWLAGEAADAVVLELRASLADGHALLTRLAAEPTDAVPVLLLGGSEHEPAVLEALQLGAADHLAEPLLLPLALRRVRHQLAARAQQLQLAEQSPVDRVTGIASRWRFNDTLPSLFANAQRRNEALALLLLDVDCFAAYNARYGERAGDEALLHIGRTLAASRRRPLDLFAHFGGGRFACVLPNTDLVGALAVAELHRGDVLDLAIEHADSVVGPALTISLGAAATTPAAGENVWELLEAAEAALARAKQGGRNRVAH